MMQLLQLDLLQIDSAKQRRANQILRRVGPKEQAFAIVDLRIDLIDSVTFDLSDEMPTKRPARVHLQLPQTCAVFGAIPCQQATLLNSNDEPGLVAPSQHRFGLR